MISFFLSFGGQKTKAFVLQEIKLHCAPKADNPHDVKSHSCTILSSIGFVSFKLAWKAFRHFVKMDRLLPPLILNVVTLSTYVRFFFSWPRLERRMEG